MPLKRAKKRKDSTARKALYWCLFLSAAGLGGLWFAFGKASCVNGGIKAAEKELNTAYEIESFEKGEGFNLVKLPVYGTDLSSFARITMGNGTIVFYRVSLGLAKTSTGSEQILAIRHRDQIYGAIAEYLSKLTLTPAADYDMEKPKGSNDLGPACYLREINGGPLMTLKDIELKVQTLLNRTGLDFVKILIFSYFKVLYGTGKPLACTPKQVERTEEEQGGAVSESIGGK